MQDRQTIDQLLSFYWDDEPIYGDDPRPKSLRAVARDRLNALAVFIAYSILTAYLVTQLGSIPLWEWALSFLLANFVADFISGIVHIAIDFLPSDKPTVFHKELFLSRVHHHELFRPARLDLASLWLTPAKYALVIVGPMAALAGSMASALLPFLIFLLWLCSLSQVFHAAAHGKWTRAPWLPLVHILQRAYLMIPNKVHLRHHQSIDRNFCVLNGLANPILNFIFLKAIVSRIDARCTVDRQRQQIRDQIRFPYRELLEEVSSTNHIRGPA